MSASGLYVLKGGANLRFYCGSPRYSEDMDLHVHRGKVAVGTLKKNGYMILDDPAFLRSLRASGIDSLDINDRTKAKHTDTTQRFRLGLILTSGKRIPTKVEFSRRGIDPERTVNARIDVEITRTFQRGAFFCTHYVDREAARQKLDALANRTLPQARDIFDLDLLASRGVDLQSLSDELEVDVRTAALDNLLAVDFEAYRDQVLEYLTEDVRGQLGRREDFERMQTSLAEIMMAS